MCEVWMHRVRSTGDLIFCIRTTASILIHNTFDNINRYDNITWFSFMIIWEWYQNLLELKITLRNEIFEDQQSNVTKALTNPVRQKTTLSG